MEVPGSEAWAPLEFVPPDLVKARKSAAPATVPVAATHFPFWLPAPLSGVVADCAAAALRGAAHMAAVPRILTMFIIHPKERS